MFFSCLFSLISYQVMGFDCEWVSGEDGKARPVALLQLATSSGLCVLVRLCFFSGVLPVTLYHLMADRR